MSKGQKLTKEEAAKMKADLEKELEEYDAKVRMQLEAWKNAEDGTDEKEHASMMVKYWADKANKIIKILCPKEYEDKCWLI